MPRMKKLPRDCLHPPPHSRPKINFEFQMVLSLADRSVVHHRRRRRRRRSRFGLISFLHSKLCPVSDLEPGTKNDYKNYLPLSNIIFMHFLRCLETIDSVNCGQSYKQLMLVIYDSRVIIWGIFKSGMTLES